jgi:hypothetical protein
VADWIATGVVAQAAVTAVKTCTKATTHSVLGPPEMKGGLSLRD